MTETVKNWKVEFTTREKNFSRGENPKKEVRFFNYYFNSNDIFKRIKGATDLKNHRKKINQFLYIVHTSSYFQKTKVEK